jgi:hypothetical protein
MYGYNVSKKLNQFLKDYFRTNPFVAPSEIIRSYSFPNVPNQNGIDTQMNITITHATQLIVLFPHTPYDCTCFLNPKYDNLYIKMIDQQFPDTPVNTTTASFFRSQLQADDLGVGFQCSDSFENSYMVDFSGKIGERFYTHTDIPDFAFVQRLDAPHKDSLFSEGAQSNQNTVIALSGKSTTQGEEEAYHNISEGNVEIQNRTPR